MDVQPRRRAFVAAAAVALLVAATSAARAVAQEEDFFSPSAVDQEARFSEPSGYSYLSDPEAWVAEMRRTAETASGPRVRRAVNAMYAPVLDPQRRGQREAPPRVSPTSSLSFAPSAPLGEGLDVTGLDAAEDGAAAAELGEEVVDGGTRRGDLFDPFGLRGGGARREPIVGDAVLGVLDLARDALRATNAQASSAIDDATRAIADASRRAAQIDGGASSVTGIADASRAVPATVNFARLAADVYESLADGLRGSAERAANAVLSPEQQEQLEGFNRRVAAEAVQTALEWQITAPVGRWDLGDSPGAAGAMARVQNLVGDLARRRRQPPSAMSPPRAAVPRVSSEAVIDDDVTGGDASSFVRRLLAAFGIGSRQESGTVTAMHQEPTLAADGGRRHHGMSSEMVEVLCQSEVITTREGISLEDVDRAYARAVNQASEIRVPVGCVRGCILGGGFFDNMVSGSVVRVRDIVKPQRASWLGTNATVIMNES